MPEVTHMLSANFAGNGAIMIHHTVFFDDEPSRRGWVPVRLNWVSATTFMQELSFAIKAAYEEDGIIRPLSPTQLRRAAAEMLVLADKRERGDPRD